MKDIVSLTEACEMLGVSRQWVYVLTRRGDLEIKDGGITVKSIEEHKVRPKRKPGRKLGYTVKKRK